MFNVFQLQVFLLLLTFFTLLEHSVEFFQIWRLDLVNLYLPIHNWLRHNFIPLFLKLCKHLIIHDRTCPLIVLHCGLSDRTDVWLVRIESSFGQKLIDTFDAIINSWNIDFVHYESIACIFESPESKDTYYFFEI